jgi:hypothetical protein
MRGDPQAARTGWAVTVPRRHWPSLISRMRQVQRSRAKHRLELIERMRSEEWRALRSGEYVPEPGWQRRWR